MPVNPQLLAQIGPMIGAHITAIGQYLRAQRQAGIDHINDIYPIFHAFIENDYNRVLTRHRFDPIENHITALYNFFKSKIQDNSAFPQIRYFNGQDTRDTIRHILTHCMQYTLSGVYNINFTNVYLQQHPYIPLSLNYKRYVGKEVYNATVGNALEGGFFCGRMARNAAWYAVHLPTTLGIVNDTLDYIADNPVAAARNVASTAGHVAVNVARGIKDKWQYHPIQASTEVIVTLGLSFFAAPSSASVVSRTIDPNLLIPAAAQPITRTLVEIGARVAAKELESQASSLAGTVINATSSNAALQSRALSEPAVNAAITITEMSAHAKIVPQAKALMNNIELPVVLAEASSVAKKSFQNESVLTVSGLPLQQCVIQNDNVVQTEDNKCILLEYSAFLDFLLQSFRNDNLFTQEELLTIKKQWDEIKSFNFLQPVEDHQIVDALPNLSM